MKRTNLLLMVILIVAYCGNAMAAGKPLKVYILAGQSNMEGHAKVETFDYIGEDPATAPLLKAMRAPDGTPRVCERVWISYLTGAPGGNLGEGFGKLTAGFGSRSNPKENGGEIGPELTFGITMEQAYDGPILIIKTAWGGKSLNTDFRSPSAGPYKLSASQQNLPDREKREAERIEKSGVYYRLMVEHVKKVLANPKRICPDYDEEQGYEISGFVWFQAWNDMCDGQTYPDSNKPGGYAEYSRLMAHFIRDVRKDLSAPKMTFVIGVIGVDGDTATGGLANLRPAMSAPAAMPEFKGNVAAVETAPFWDEKMESLLPKKGKINARFEAAHLITEDGVMEAPEVDERGWKPLGMPRPEERVWRFTSFNPQKKSDELTIKEKKRFRDVTLPAGLQGWEQPDFDDSAWNRGKAPIGKGEWKHRTIGKGTVQFNSDWGEGEFLLARTTFEVDNLNYESYRISVLARQGFHIYLNGQKINTYVWWKDEPFYRPIVLGPEHTKYLKKGKNVLAAYANVEMNRNTGVPHASLDLSIEAITKEGKTYVNSEAYIQKQMDQVCTREEQKIIKGASNAGFHYLGSGKILAQIGKAFADAMLEME